MFAVVANLAAFGGVWIAQFVILDRLLFKPVPASPPTAADSGSAAMQPRGSFAGIEPGKDPRRWISLAVVTMAVVIVALDTTVLNVAIPTILREFDTTLPTLQWVITGYALTFASLLIIGGRLGDIFGHRRMFIIGAAMFGCGSLIAGLSQNVGMLVVGEAIIEGMGASLMMPATLAILSTSFVGRERATAFGIWGAVGGASGALGPVVGGILTSNFSWRWAFGINVIVTPLAIVGALLFMQKGVRKKEREPLDIQGALLIASGMFLLVFGLSEGATYGWWEPTRDFVIGGVTSGRRRCRCRSSLSPSPCRPCSSPRSSSSSGPRSGATPRRCSPSASCATSASATGCSSRW